VFCGPLRVSLAAFLRYMERQDEVSCPGPIELRVLSSTRYFFPREVTLIRCGPSRPLLRDIAL